MVVFTWIHLIDMTASSIDEIEQVLDLTAEDLNTLRDRLKKPEIHEIIASEPKELVAYFDEYELGEEWIEDYRMYKPIKIPGRVLLNRRLGKPHWSGKNFKKVA